MKTNESNEKRWVLVTGASTGIGRATAELLAKKGFGVYACARKQQDLDDLEKIDNITSIKLDVTSAEEVGSAVKFVEKQGTGLYGLVNNAGMSYGGLLIDTTMEDMKNIFDVNVFGVHRVTQAFFTMIYQAKGRIINMSSGNGYFSYPFTGPYNMTKFSLESYSETLRRELLFTDIKVVIINPGQIKTPIWDKAIGKAIDHLEKTKDNSRMPEFVEFGKNVANNVLNGVNRNAKPPEIIAEAIHEALTVEDPKIRYQVPLNKLMYRMMRILPGKQLDKFVKKELQKMM